MSKKIIVIRSIDRLWPPDRQRPRQGGPHRLRLDAGHHRVYGVRPGGSVYTRATGRALRHRWRTVGFGLF